MPLKNFLLFAIMLLASIGVTYSQEEKVDDKTTKNTKTSNKKDTKTFSYLITD